MSHDAGEVSWQTLRRIVRDWSGDKAEIEQVRSLEGGSISTTLLLTTKSGDRAVLKLSPHRVDRSFQREARQLELLRSVGLPAPRVLSLHVGTLEAPDSYLLIEFLPGMNLHEVREHATPEELDALQRDFADLVAGMHSHTADAYGRVESGASPSTASTGQPESTNGRLTWPQFYRGLYDAIWQECQKHAHLPVKSRKLIDKVHDRLDKLLSHDDKPRLTHGDLWWSNVLVDRDPSGAGWRVTGLLDPNCKYAHNENELAYLELFQTTTPQFTRAYAKTLRIAEEYHRVRRPVYQLYELINHVNLFGDRYAKPLAATLEKVAPLV